MSNDIKLVGFRADLEKYREIRSYAEEHGMSVSDLLREAVEYYLTNDKSANPTEFNAIKQQFENQLEKQDEYLKEKDTQIERLHQLLAMKEQNMATIAKQLEHKDILLEDMRSRSVWKKIKTALGFSGST